MDKREVDQLYHLLRRACVDGGKDPGLLLAIDGIAKHTVSYRNSGGDYGGLLRFLDWYGNKFLIKPIVSYLKSPTAYIKMNGHERVIDLGCGLGWLGRGIAQSFRKDVLSVDKRLIHVPPYSFRADGHTSDFKLMNLETYDGVNALIEELKPTDLIIGSEFLHCIDDPRLLLSKLNAWDRVFIEQCITPTYSNAHISGYHKSYIAQLELYGARCMKTSDLPIGEIAIIPIHTHSMIILKKTVGLSKR